MGGERNREQDGLSPFESKYCKDHVNLKLPESEANMEGNRGMEGKGQPPSPQQCHPSILIQPYLKQDPLPGLHSYMTQNSFLFFFFYFFVALVSLSLFFVTQN